MSALTPGIRAGRGLKLYGWPRLVYSDSSIVLGDNVGLGAATLAASPNAELILGSRTSVFDYSVLWAQYGIRIGNDVMIAEHVTIRDFDHCTESVDRPMNTQGFVGAPVLIEDDVWIARGACILKGVTVGRGAIVGANAVVNRDVPPGAIVGGVPARVIRYRGTTAPIPPGAEPISRPRGGS